MLNMLILINGLKLCKKSFYLYELSILLIIKYMGNIKKVYILVTKSFYENKNNTLY